LDLCPMSFCLCKKLHKKENTLAQIS